MAAAAMLQVAASIVMMSLFLASRRQVEAQDTPSRNDVIIKPECDSNARTLLRYSASSERLYLESADGITRGGCVTLTQIWEQLAGRVPLYAVEPGSGNVSTTATGTWLLTETLYVEDGITLQVKWFNFLWWALSMYVCEMTHRSCLCVSNGRI